LTAAGGAAGQERAWHLSGPDGAARAEPTDPDGIIVDGVPDHAAQGGAAPPALPPLWFRIITGASFGWRLRALRRRITRRRQRLARAALRWLQLHAPVRSLLEQGRPLAALRMARRDHASAVAVHWPRVPLPVSHCGVDPRHPLVRYVTAPDGSDPTRVVTVGARCPHAPGEHAGAAVVGIGAAPAAARVVVGGGGPAGAALWLPDAFDPALHHPRGFNQRRSAGDLTISPWQVREQSRSLFEGLHNGRSVTVAPVADAGDPYALAGGLIGLAAHGAPLLAARLPPAVAAIIGDDLVTLLASVTVADMHDLRVRELHSVRLRRAAVRAHGPAARWRQILDAVGSPQRTLPSLSVLMASKRPRHVLEAVRQIAAQRGDTPQLVIGLHGSSMPAGIEEQVRARYPGEVVLRAFDEEMNLGEVLDALARTADGALISKWDDDDWYDAEHLDDTRWALEYSGGTLVGKAAEFVYLEQLDVTMRRHAYGAETFSTTVAGGTLTMARADLLAIGGWPPAVRQADRRLIARVQECGGQVYRTHGFGYVLRRAGAQQPAEHTWQIGDDYFLLAATDQRPGLALGFAGFGDHPAHAVSTGVAGSAQPPAVTS
jgi:hypothetical protein